MGMDDRAEQPLHIDPKRILISSISHWALKPTYHKASIKHGPSLEVQVPLSRDLLGFDLIVNVLE